MTPPTPETLDPKRVLEKWRARRWEWPAMEELWTALEAATDAREADRKSCEVLRSGIRSLWHGVVDGDMDRLSVGYALKELFR